MTSHPTPHNLPLPSARLLDARNGEPARADAPDLGLARRAHKAADVAAASGFHGTAAALRELAAGDRALVNYMFEELRSALDDVPAGFDLGRKKHAHAARPSDQPSRLIRSQSRMAERGRKQPPSDTAGWCAPFGWPVSPT